MRLLYFRGGPKDGKLLTYVNPPPDIIPAGIRSNAQYVVTEVPKTPSMSFPVYYADFEYLAPLSESTAPAGGTTS